MKMNKYLLGFIALLILISGVAIGVFLVGQNQDIREKAAPATVAYITPSNFDNQIGTDFTFYVKMDSASNQISGVDIRLNYNKDAFQIISLEKGSGATNLETVLFSTIDSANGKIKYIAYTGDKTKALSGTGIEILKVNAKSKAGIATGTYPITFDTETVASGLTETQNILTLLTPANVNLVTTAVGGPVDGEPNSCGGTCGSNYNCKANFYCYKGYCRNPLCSDEIDCNCSSATTAPTTKPTTKPITKGGTTTAKSSIKPTATYVPSISKESLGSSEPLTRTTQDLKAPENQFFAKYAIYILIGFILIVISTIYYAVKKRNYNNIPHILPPTNI